MSDVNPAPLELRAMYSKKRCGATAWPCLFLFAGEARSRRRRLPGSWTTKMRTAVPKRRLMDDPATASRARSGRSRPMSGTSSSITANMLRL